MRPRIQDLPLPKNGRHLQIWYTRFVPLLISWAGTQEDPFGTTGRIDGTVQSLWERVFPDLVINNVEMMIVIIMVSLYYEFDPVRYSVSLIQALIGREHIGQVAP